MYRPSRFYARLVFVVNIISFIYIPGPLLVKYVEPFINVLSPVIQKPVAYFIYISSFILWSLLIAYLARKLYEI